MKTYVFSKNTRRKPLKTSRICIQFSSRIYYSTREIYSKPFCMYIVPSVRAIWRPQAISLGNGGGLKVWYKRLRSYVPLIGLVANGSMDN
jgi:hypothetical protein